jgi:hypothetical protein
MGICNIEQASKSARKEAKTDVIGTSSPERVPDRSPGPFLCALMGVVLPQGSSHTEDGRAFEVLVTATIFFPINSWASKGCYNL